MASMRIYIGVGFIENGAPFVALEPLSLPFRFSRLADELSEIRRGSWRKFLRRVPVSHEQITYTLNGKYSSDRLINPSRYGRNEYDAVLLRVDVLHWGKTATLYVADNPFAEALSEAKAHRELMDDGVGTAMALARE